MEFDYTHIKSAFMCDCCPLAAIFYSTSGPFKTSTRCHKHKPSFLRTIPAAAHYHRKGSKFWVACQEGISLAMQKDIEQSYQDPTIKK